MKKVVAFKGNGRGKITVHDLTCRHSCYRIYNACLYENVFSSQEKYQGHVFVPKETKTTSLYSEKENFATVAMKLVTGIAVHSQTHERNRNMVGKNTPITTAIRVTLKIVTVNFRNRVLFFQTTEKKCRVDGKS